MFLTIKYIPIIQLIGMLINNSLYTYDINIEFDYIGDFLLGNSIVNISMLYVCSFTFGFCNWHRHIITANLINIIIATIDKVFHIPVTDIELLSSYYVIAGIFIIIAARSHVKDIQNDKRKDKNPFGMFMLQLMHNIMIMFVYTKIGFLILQKNN